MMQDELEQKIRARAYEIWELEGRMSGRDEEHWYRAESELRAELIAAVSAGSKPAVDARVDLSLAGALIEAPALEAPPKKTRTRRAAAKAEEAPPVVSKRRRSPA